MPVNIYDIAKKSGLSVVTVSRVLNNYPSVRGKNREKVLAVMRELEYKPNAAARTLAKGKTGMIGLILTGLGDSFVTQVVESIEKILKEMGMFLVVSIAPNGFELKDKDGINLFIEDRVDGVLMMSPILNSNYILELKKKNVPFVLIDQFQLNMKVPCVTVDNFYGGYQATMCLINGGAKTIAHISGADIFDSSKERTMGYMKALSENGLITDERLIIEGDFTVESGYKAVEGWLQQGILPDAVFAADDNTAFGVLDAARENNISIPGRLAVIGYDDHPFTSLLHPRISTVKQPAEKMAECGVELLLEIIEGKSKRLSKVSLKPTIVLRDTTNNNI